MVDASLATWGSHFGGHCSCSGIPRYVCQLGCGFWWLCTDREYVLHHSGVVVGRTSSFCKGSQHVRGGLQWRAFSVGDAAECCNRCFHDFFWFNVKILHSSLSPTGSFGLPAPPHPGGRAIQLVHTQFRTLKFAKQMRLDIHRWWACWERSTVGLASYVNACYWRSSPCHGRRWLPIQFLRGPHQGMEVLYNIRTSLGTWLSRRSWATMVLGHVQPLTKHDFQLFSYTCW